MPRRTHITRGRSAREHPPIGRRRPRSRRVWWWRSAWALVLALHLPMTWGALSAWRSGDGEAASVPLLLLASNLFFIAEIVFAKTLSLLRSRRSIFVFALIVALIHAGSIIDRGLYVEKPWADGAPWSVLGVAGILAMGAVRRLIGCKPGGTPGGDLAARLRRALFRLATSPLRHVCSRYWRSAGYRAPPVLG